MNSRSSAAITTTIVATVGSPPKRPRRATARAKQTVSAPSASAAPRPNDAPPLPAANPEPIPHATASAGSHGGLPVAAQRREQRAWPAAAHDQPHHRRRSARARARRRTRCRRPTARRRARASATAATTAVARSRAIGTKTARASAGAAAATSESRSALISAHFGSVETSLSHFVRRRVRSADEPYLAKS